MKFTTYQRPNLNALMRWLVGLLCSIVLLLNSHCTKTIEDYPLEVPGIDIVFDPTDSLGVNAVNFHNNIYSNLPQGFNRIGTTTTGSGIVGVLSLSANILDAGSDDAVANAEGDNIEFYQRGSFDTFVLPDNVWSSNYAGIRKVNIFLKNIHVVPFSEAGLENRLIAEAKVLRAIFYFELLKRWGGVPIIGDTIFEYDTQIQVPRNSFQECVDYIVQQLDEAYPDLRGSNGGSPVFAAEFGRVSQGFVWGLKSRLYLYAASPLHNPSGALDKWALAADAARRFIENVNNQTFAYSLHTATATAHVNSTNVRHMSADANYATYVNRFLNIFSTRFNNEIILARMSGTNQILEQLNGPVGNQRGDLGKTNPTQNFVDAFEMRNGLEISASNSGYDASNPYYNRDPRLAGSVFVNGMPWTGRSVETFDGGLDRPQGYGNVNSTETRTGYYMRKFLTDNGNQTARANANHNFPYMRYAEILLNYAEAQNEAAGPVLQVYTAINQVRSRVGMPNLPAGLSQSQMRSRIRQERRVELAFEEHRFFDIRRWNIAGEVFASPLYGIQITRAADGRLSYNRVSIFTPYYIAPKMNLYPIPFNEMSSNRAMVQNPEWN